MSLPFSFARPYREELARHFVEVDVQYDENLIKTLKEIPGVTWGPMLGYTKKWLCPIELQRILGEVAVGAGYVNPDLVPTSTPLESPFVEGRHPWQQKAEAFLLANGYGALMFAPGLGKSRPTVEAAAKAPGRCLWIAPAMTRQTVAREIEKWAPGVSIGIVGDKKRAPDGQRFIVCSYQMLERVVDGETRFSTIVVDEFHNVANKKAQRSKLVREVTERQKPDLLALLSGTPMPNRVQNLWNPLDIMCPRRFGTEYKFQERYCLVGHNGYGRTLNGLNPAYAEELRERLAAIGVRATEEDAVGVLPPLNLYVEWQEATSIQDTLENAALDEQQFMVRAVDQKIKWGTEVLREELEAERKVAIVTWHRDVADRIAKANDVEAIHGGMPATKRDAELSRLAADPAAPLVCTMASIAEGLNQLVAYNNVVLVETYYRPASVAQALKRFHRLTSLAPVSVRVLGLTNTLDERIIDSLISKTSDINQLIKAGAVEGAIEGLVEQADLSSMLDGWTGGDV